MMVEKDPLHGRLRTWRALDDADAVTPFRRDLVEALRTGRVATRPGPPSSAIVQCDLPDRRFFVVLPVLDGTTIDRRMDAPTLLGAALRACEDAAPDIDQENAIASTRLILTSVGETRTIVPGCRISTTYDESSLPSVWIPDGRGVDGRWVEPDGKDVLHRAAALMLPLWFRPDWRTSGTWRCDKAPSPQRSVDASPMDPVETMRTIDRIERDTRWQTTI